MKVITIPLLLLVAMSTGPISADEPVDLGRRPLGEESRSARAAEGRQAFAVGAVLPTVTITWSARLASAASLTVNSRTYIPFLSGTNVGVELEGKNAGIGLFDLGELFDERLETIDQLEALAVRALAAVQAQHVVDHAVEPLAVLVDEGKQPPRRIVDRGLFLHQLRRVADRAEDEITTAGIDGDPSASEPIRNRVGI